MKLLHDDQIHNAPFIKLCTIIWSDDVSRAEKSGVWDYYVGISNEFGKPLVDHTNIPQSGIIFVGMCHLIESVFQSIPKNGNYIIIHRTNDRQYLPEFDAVKPPSVKHVYTVDCKGTFSNVTAIPFGNASINGEDPIVKMVAQEPKRKNLEAKLLSDKRIFVCYNTNPDTPHRNASIPAMKAKPFAFVYELDYPVKQMPVDEFARNVHDHEFTMALAGCGADASRQWMAMQLGSIPIVTDCPQMRHFADLPMVFCPEFDLITDEWLDEQKEIVKTKSTERMRMSYWVYHVTQKRNEHGI